MSLETTTQVNELLLQSYRLENGDELIMLLEEAVRLADSTGQLDLQYEAREGLTRACVFGGAAEKAIVSFSWCLAQFDKHPEMFSEWSLLWQYKWIVGLVPHYPQISKKQILEMYEDMERRFLSGGYDLRVIYQHRYRFERLMGKRQEALRFYRMAEEIPRDALSNCETCEIDERVTFALFQGDDARALQLAAPIIEGGRTCASVPHRTYAELLLPLLRLKRLEEAWEYQRLGYRLIADNKSFLDRVACHLVFLALVRDMTRAVKLFSRHYVWTEQNADLLHRFRFFRAACLLFELLEEEGRQSVTLSLPETFPLYDESKSYATAELSEHFRQLAQKLARQFDQRNETACFSTLLDEVQTLKNLRP